MPSRWVVVKKVKDRLERVYMVKREQQGRHQIGYLKYETVKSRRRLGRSLANELITTRLAKLAGLPAADVEVAHIGGKAGIVSIARPEKPLLPWNDLGRFRHQHIESSVVRPWRLLKVFVFDVWTCNIDRHGKNIIVYPRNSKYDFYMIDHSFTLLSAAKWTRQSWNSKYWNHRAARVDPNYLPGVPRFIRRHPNLSPYIRSIQQIKDTKVAAVVQSIPSHLLNAQEKQIVTKMLLQRKRVLHTVVPLWLKEYKKKTRLTPWVSP